MAGKGKGVFVQLAETMRSQKEARHKAAAPKQAKGTLGEIGGRMQSMRQARGPVRKQAKGTLGQVGAMLNRNLKDL